MATNPSTLSMPTGGAFGSGYASYQSGPSPYLTAQANDIQRRSTLGLQDAFNGIQSDAVGVGGVGGSREGIMQGLAASRAADSLQGQLASLYGNDWTNQQNRNLQQYGMDTNAALGLNGQNIQRYGIDANTALGMSAQDLQRYGINVNAALGLNGQDQNFYTQQRQLDQSGAQLGAQLYGLGNTGYLSQGSGLQSLGTTQQTAPWTNLNNYSNVLNQYSGLGGNNLTTSAGGGISGALGGALAGQTIANNLGFGGNTTTYNGYGVNTGNLPDYNGTAAMY